MKRLRGVLQNRDGRIALLQIVLSLFASYIGCRFIQNEMASLVVIILASISAYGAAMRFSQIVSEQADGRN